MAHDSALNLPPVSLMQKQEARQMSRGLREQIFSAAECYGCSDNG